MERIEITREIMEGARTYLPETEKEAFLDWCQDRCFDRIRVSTDGNQDYPPMYRMASGMRTRYLSGALAGLYLGIEYEKAGEDPYLPKDADTLEGSFLLNQIERWKSDKALRDKCFDMLSDYRELEKRLSTQVHGLLAVQNDPVVRQMLLTQMQAQILPGLVEELKRVQQERKEQISSDD